MYLHIFSLFGNADLNIDISISPHKWRHTLPTFLLESNININQVNDVLGHTELTTTKKYLQNDKKRLIQSLLICENYVKLPLSILSTFGSVLTFYWSG